MSDIEIAQRATMKPIVGLAQERLGIGKELRERLGNILAGCNHDDKTPIFARDLKAHGAMASLLKDALRPNLVQTLENNPVFIHGGPFANIALGCNSHPDLRCCRHHRRHQGALPVRATERGIQPLPGLHPKTQSSFSADPNLKGATSGHVLPIREVRPVPGAEFVVVIRGSIMTMPGLPKVPAAERIDVDGRGKISGVF